jgi:hypothetical protein
MLIQGLAGGLCGLFMAQLGYNYTTPEFWVALMGVSALASAVK